MLERHLRVKLLVAVIVAILMQIILWYTVQSITPPDHGQSKDPGFRIDLPWELDRCHKITSGGGYGSPSHQNGPSGHTQDYYALDFDLGLDEPVHPVAEGRVEYVGKGWAECKPDPEDPGKVKCEGLGNIVYIKHRDGYSSLYAHLNTIDKSLEGQVVGPNTLIGGAGHDETYVTHLHFTVYKDANFTRGSTRAGPHDGYSVVPEYFMGREAYEDLKPNDELWTTSVPILNIRALLQARTDHSARIKLILLRAEGFPLDHSFEVDTDSSGRYSGLELTNVKPGLYNVIAEGPVHLGRTKYNVNIVPGVNTVDFSDGGTFALKAGDLNDDGLIEALDLARVIRDYDPGVPQPGNPSDINNDGQVDAVDLALVIANYWERSDPYRSASFTLTSSQNSSVSTSAGSASLALFPGIVHQTAALDTEYTVNVGDIFPVDIHLDTGGSTTDGTSAIIHYDPYVLEVQDADPDKTGVQIIPGILYPMYPTNKVDPSQGTIYISGVGTPTEQFSGSGTLATIVFEAIASTDSTNVAIEFDSPGATTDSNIAEHETIAEVLGSVTDAAFDITGSPDRPPRTGNITNPQAYHYVSEYDVPVRVGVAGPYDLVDQVGFQAYYDGSWHDMGTDKTGDDGWEIYWNTRTVEDQIVKVKAFISDAAGNGIEVQNVGIILDRTPPSFVSTTFSPGCALPGKMVQISVEADDNLSGVDRIEVFANEAVDGSDSGTWNSLGSITGSSGTVSWNTAGYENGTHRIALHIQDNADNWNIPLAGLQPKVTYGIGTPVGDLDGDSDVDIADIMQVAGRLSTIVGNPDYDPIYDLDGNGEIDVRDVMAAAVHWRETCGGHIGIQPPNPTEEDIVQVIVSGEWGNSCPVVTHEHNLAGNTIEISAFVNSEPGIGCLDVVTPWSFVEEIGALPAGAYRVEVTATDLESGFWGFHDVATFSVAPGP